MNVQTAIPDWDSLIHEATPNPNFEDCFSISFTPMRCINRDELVFRCFMSFTTGWIDKLFKIRNVLVRPFGLKTSKKQESVYDFNKRIEKAENVAFFKVINLNSEEILLYADDSHLEAYFSISVYQSDKKAIVQATTTVNTKNRFGRVYLSIIKPFHKLIIKRMLKYVAIQYSIKH